MPFGDDNEVALALTIVQCPAVAITNLDRKWVWDGVATRTATLSCTITRAASCPRCASSFGSCTDISAHPASPGPTRDTEPATAAAASPSAGSDCGMPSNGPPTGEPVLAGHEPAPWQPTQDRIAAPRQRRGKVIELAIATAHGFDAGRALAALRLEPAQAGADVGAWLAQEGTQYQPIFQGESTPLRQMRQHGVGSIAQQADPALRPGGQSWQAIEPPLAVSARALEHLGERGVEGGKRSQCALPIDVALDPSPRPRLAGDDDNGDLASRAHGIVHDIGAGAEPKPDLGRGQLAGILGREHRPRRGGARKLRSEGREKAAANA